MGSTAQAPGEPVCELGLFTGTQLSIKSLNVGIEYPSPHGVGYTVVFPAAQVLGEFTAETTILKTARRCLLS